MTITRRALCLGTALFLCNCATTPDKAQPDAASASTAGATDPLDMQLVLEELDPDEDAEPDALLRVMRDEAQRMMGAGLTEGQHPTYYLSYQITEARTRAIKASFGAIESDDTSHNRWLDPMVRVGDYELDNTHKLRGQWFGDFSQSGFLPFPLTHEPAWRNLLWRATDAHYKAAVERFIEVKANTGLKAPEDKPTPDFSPAEPITYIEPIPDLQADDDVWRERVRRLSARFGEFEHVQNSNVVLQETVEVRYQVTTEGSLVRKVRHASRLAWFASAQVDDGMSLFLYDSADGWDLDAFPSEAQLAARIDETARQLGALIEAPVAEPFIGPAILDGSAAGVFFHEALGHRVEGHRQGNQDEGQTFLDKIDEQVLPTFLDIYDDPRIIEAAGQPLMGHYLVDDQAVPAARATIVDDGLFKGFLTSRTPVPGFEGSNGHGRRQPGRHVVARQANLIIHPNQTISRDQLTQELLAEIDRQGVPYGLRFERVQGGFTMTGRGMPQSFTILPLVVYRVFPDGSEELIRGVTLEGTPLTVLSEIAAAADDVQIFNGMCGAESGYVPVSAVSPSLLVRRVETARAPKAAERPPILAPPPLTEPAPTSGDTP